MRGREMGRRGRRRDEGGEKEGGGVRGRGGER